MRECINCKYGRGIGSDVWCGHTPRGKESYMMETDCVYFEEMRFGEEDDKNVQTIKNRYQIRINPETEEEYIVDTHISEEVSVDEFLDVINKLFDEDKKQKEAIIDLKEEVFELKREMLKLKWGNGLVGKK